MFSLYLNKCLFNSDVVDTSLKMGCFYDNICFRFATMDSIITVLPTVMIVDSGSCMMTKP